MKIIKYADAQSVMAQIAEALAKGETFTVEPKKPEKWKPKRAENGEEYYGIVSDGSVLSSRELDYPIDAARAWHGNYYLRKDHADKARDPDRLRNIFRLFVLEHAPEYNIYGPGVSIIFIGYAGKAELWNFEYSVPGAITAPREVAKKFRDLYNAGLIDMGDE